jgi:hypothetical protein
MAGPARLNYGLGAAGEPWGGVVWIPDPRDPPAGHARPETRGPPVMLWEMGNEAVRLAYQGESKAVAPPGAGRGRRLGPLGPGSDPEPPHDLAAGGGGSWRLAVARARIQGPGPCPRPPRCTHPLPAATPLTTADCGKKKGVFCDNFEQNKLRHYCAANCATILLRCRGLGGLPGCARKRAQGLAIHQSTPRNGMTRKSSSREHSFRRSGSRSAAPTHQRNCNTRAVIPR